MCNVQWLAALKCVEHGFTVSETILNFFNNAKWIMQQCLLQLNYKTFFSL